MAQLFSDDGKAFLQAGILAAATSMTVTAILADHFPVATAAAWPAGSDDWFKVILQNVAGDREVIYVGTRSSGSGVMGNLLRGQEGTTAQNWNVGDAVVCSITALDVMNALAGIFAQLVISGAFECSGKAYTVPVAVTPVAGVVTIDASESNVFYVDQLTANVTSIVVNNPTDGQTINVRFIEDSAGGGTRTVVPPAGAKVYGAITTGASRVSWLQLTYVGPAARHEGAWVGVPA